MSGDEKAVSRYHCLLRLAYWAMIGAEHVEVINTPDFLATMATALEDDCPVQSSAARRAATQAIRAKEAVEEFRGLVLKDHI